MPAIPSVLLLSFHLRLGLRSRLSSSGFPTTSLFSIKNGPNGIRILLRQRWRSLDLGYDTVQTTKKIKSRLFEWKAAVISNRRCTGQTSVVKPHFTTLTVQIHKGHLQINKHYITVLSRPSQGCQHRKNVSKMTASITSMTGDMTIWIDDTDRGEMRATRPVYSILLGQCPR